MKHLLLVFEVLFSFLKQVVNLGQDLLGQGFGVPVLEHANLHLQLLRGTLEIALNTVDLLILKHVIGAPDRLKSLCVAGQVEWVVFWIDLPAQPLVCVNA